MSSTALKIALLLTANTKKAGSDIEGFTKKAQANLNALKKASTWSDMGNKQMLQGAAMAAPIIAAIKLAADLEDKIADVAKVTNAEFGSAKFKALEQSAIRVSNELGRSATEVGALMAELASGGVAETELEKISLLAGKVGVAFDVAAGDAGKAFMQIQNALGLTSDKTKLVMDAMNAATNKFGGKASYLLDFMSGGGASVSQSLKVSAIAMQAFGNSMQNVGIESSEAATTMERFQKAILTNAKVAAIFNKAGGGSQGLVAILEKAKESGNAAQWLLDNKFGEYSTKLAQMANNMNNDKGLKAQLGYLSNSNNVEGSSDAEFANRQKTTSEQFKKLKTEALNVAVTLGSTLLPVVNDLMQAAKPYIESIAKWIGNNRELTGTLMKTAAGLAVGKIALGGIFKGVSGVISVFGKLRTGITILGNVFSATKKFYQILRLSSAINSFARGGSIIAKVFGVIKKGASIARLAFGFLGKAVLWVGRLFIANPIVAAIVGIATAAYLIYKYWEPIKGFFIKLWDGVKKAFLDVFENIKSKFMFLKELITNPIGMIKKLGDINLFGDKAPMPQPIPLANNSIAFSPNITLHGGATQADAQMISDATYKQFEQFQKRYDHNQKRRGIV